MTTDSTTSRRDDDPTDSPLDGKAAIEPGPEPAAPPESAALESPSPESGPAKHEASSLGPLDNAPPEGGQTNSGRSTSARPKTGRLLAALALLVALAALGGAGYLYYALIASGDVRATAHQVSALENRLDGLDQTLQQRVDQLGERQQAALDELREQQQAARAATEKALRQSLAEVARQAPPSTGEWQRAEAEYLLRIANHRLLLERDVPGALRLLQAADSVLRDLDDFALHEVRAQIADEIAALEGVKHIDIDGLFLRLEAVKNHLDQLPLKEPSYLRHEATPPPAPATGWWEVLKQRLAGLVQVRHLDGPAKPLLEPEQAVYLQLNLRLMLERAQLAAVRRDQLIYVQSLDTAMSWIREYLDAGKPSIQRMLAELGALAQVDLTQPLPDISGSLNALKEVLRHPS